MHERVNDISKNMVLKKDLHFDPHLGEATARVWFLVLARGNYLKPKLENISILYN